MSEEFSLKEKEKKRAAELCLKIEGILRGERINVAIISLITSLVALQRHIKDDVSLQEIQQLMNYMAQAAAD